jgi:hypothetical protein
VEIFLGSAPVFLQPLAYGIDVDEEVGLSNYRGVTVGRLAVHVALCSPDGALHEGFEHVQGPEDLLDKRIDIAVKLNHGSEIQWLQEDESRGVVCKFRFYTDPKYRETKPVRRRQQPVFKYSKQFTLPKATQNFLNYLQTNALILELWGLQGDGRASSGPPRVRSAIQLGLDPLVSPEPTPSPRLEASGVEPALDAVLREAAWLEERRHLQELVHRLQQEIDFLQIEKGVLARVRKALEGIMGWERGREAAHLSWALAEVVVTAALLHWV